MIRNLLFGSIMAKIIMAMVCLAVWQNYNGDLVAIAGQGWNVLEGGAQVVNNLWSNFRTTMPQT